MRKRDHSETSKNGEENDYERQRVKRIEENRARMAALGLPKMGTSLMSSSGKRKDKKEKRRKRKDEENDEEYMPAVEESEVHSSGEEDEEEWSASQTAKGKKKSSIPKKKIQAQKLESNSDFDDEDENSVQALALSIETNVHNINEGCSGLAGYFERQPTSGKSTERNRVACIKKETGHGKKRKKLSSRVQMTEDELVVHFFQFDEAGKGAISVKDLELMAATHDFTWTDKELADMIYCFDTVGDRKLCLDDFRKIVRRCNMIQNA